MTYQPAEGGGGRGAAVAARLAELGVERPEGDLVIPRTAVESDWGGACDELAAAIDDLLHLSFKAKDPETAAAFAQAAFLLQVQYDQQCVFVTGPGEAVGGETLPQ